MLFAGQTRAELRRSYLDAWRSSRAGGPLSPLQAQIAAVIGQHPEYWGWLEDESALDADFDDAAGSNPFLHLGLHLAVRDQVATDRPAGIRELAQRLGARLGPHEAEHRIMERLGQALWEAQRSGRGPDERLYLEALRGLL
jgi:hypothetical protein